MKKLSTLLFFICLSVLGFSQNDGLFPVNGSVTHFPSPAVDSITSITYDMMGNNFYFTGRTDTVSPYGDAYLIKYDNNIQAIEWTKKMGNAAGENQYNSSIVFGMAKSFGGDVLAGGFAYNGMNFDMKLTGFYTDGYVYLDTTYDYGIGHDAINYLYQEWEYSSEAQAAGYITSASGKDAIAFTLDKYSGNILNEDIFSYPGDEEFNSYVQDGMGNGYAVGYSTSFGSGDKDIFFAIMGGQPMGKASMFTFDTIYGGSGDDIAYDIAFDNMSYEFLIVGSTESAAGNKDIYVIRVDQSGNVIWERTYGNPNTDDEAFSIDLNSIEGATYYISGYTTNEATGDRDVYFLEIDYYGNIVIEKAYGTTDNELVTDIVYNNCNVFMAGHNSDSDDMFLMEHPILYDNITKQDLECFGDYSGSVNAEITGGFNSYSVVWTDDFGGSGTYSQSLSYIPAGNYYMYAYESMTGCEIYDTVVLTEPEAIIINPIITDISCGNFCDGAIDLTVTGGVPPYSFEWSNLVQSQNISDLCEGTYWADIYDNNGCWAYMQDVYISSPGPTSMGQVTDVVHNTCYGACEGSARVIATQGVEPYTYLWDDGQTDSLAVGLCAGVHTVEVWDIEGCSGYTVEITEPEMLAATIEQSDVSCFGINNGSATASAFGGTPPYEYLWDDPTLSTTMDISLLYTGLYSLTLTDSYLCTFYSSVYINEPDTLVLNVSSLNDVSCFGGNNGSVAVNANGGVTPYVYHWPSGDTGPTDNNLIAGNYSVSVTDNNNCETVLGFTISQPTAIGLSVNKTDITCNGLVDGTASAITTGGTAPYSYNWSTGSSLANITGLAAGAYSLTITDGNGCIESNSTTITEPAVIEITGYALNANCGSNDGSIHIANIAGGTAPFSYSWSSGQTGTSSTGLAYGNYDVTVSDANLCTSIAMFSVGSQGVNPVIVNSNQILCFGGTASASALMTNGIPPFSFSWSGGETSSTVSNLLPGNYVVSITDSIGCNGSASFSISPAPSEINIGFSAFEASCTACDGSVWTQAYGGVPGYSYTWSTGDNTNTISNLCGGDYYITVTDANGCIKEDTIVLNTESPGVLGGFITADGNPVGNGDIVVELYKATSQLGAELVLVDLQPSGVNGLFSFTNLEPETYYIRMDVVNNSIGNYLTTYYDSIFNWEFAVPIEIGCNIDFSDEFKLYKQAPLPVLTNFGSISGTIYYEDYNTKALGDPIPGAEIYIEQEPNDEPKANTVTDAEGYYEVDSLPYGTGYKLLVDIPGLPMLSTYHNITISDGLSSVTNLNFLVDTASVVGIYIDTTTAISEYSFKSMSLTVFPNPFMEELQLTFMPEKSGVATISLHDLSGKIIFSKDDEFTNGVVKAINIDADYLDLSEGVYYLYCKFGVDILVKKVVKL